jgi:hypothetical protein
VEVRQCGSLTKSAESTLPILKLNTFQPPKEDAKNFHFKVIDVTLLLRKIFMIMILINPPQREHRYKDKIKIGLKGYFMEGPHKVAVAEVIEIIQTCMTHSSGLQ